MPPSRNSRFVVPGAILITVCLVFAALCSPAFAKVTVSTLFVDFPDRDTADIWGIAVSSEPKEPILDRGFCYNTKPVDKPCTGLGPGTGFFSLDIDLKSGTSWYVRAYATTRSGTTYGSRIYFTVPPPYNPTAVTADPVPTGPTTAILGGEVTSEGHAPVLERGVCWGTKPLNDYYDKCVAMGSGLGSFSQEIGGFEPGVTYYVRAYASSDIGTGFGADKVFSTRQDDPPNVTTTAPYNETDVSAISGGQVTNQGGSAVTARGVCWSTAPHPTISDARTNDGAGLGRFHSFLSDLEPLTEYYVRAYASNDAGTSYGEEYKFKTAHPVWPTVSTVGVLQVFDDSALLMGEVVLTGDATADERGFCWAETPQPLITDHSAPAAGAGAGEFQVMIQGLRPERLYYARAYAKNQYGVFYGRIIYFKTRFSRYPAR